MGMVAAATLEGGGEEADTTTRGTVMTTVVDGLPVATRKLFKRSKASKLDADEDMLRQLLRSTRSQLLRSTRSNVFAKAMDMYHWMQRPVSGDSSLARAKNNGGRFLSSWWVNLPEYNKYSCDECHAFFESQMQVTAYEQEDFCLTLAQTYHIESTLKGADVSQSQNSMYQSFCLDVVQCPLRTSSTPTTCCLSLGSCQDQAYYCKLNEDSGSTENYWIQTETQAECDTKSKAIGCGSCKDGGTSDNILEMAGMPTEGFVSYCRGGPCVWATQRVQCMGLKNYPDIKNQKDCADACCNDYTCAVWQFDAIGYSNQCWYGTNCDTKGDPDNGAEGGNWGPKEDGNNEYYWTYGGIRSMGTAQAPDCMIQHTYQCASDYGSSDPCCGQGGGTVAPYYQCPQSRPTCVNYVYNSHWGTCVGNG
jgi:hypothetical protein